MTDEERIAVLHKIITNANFKNAKYIDDPANNNVRIIGEAILTMDIRGRISITENGKVFSVDNATGDLYSQCIQCIMDNMPNNVWAQFAPSLVQTDFVLLLHCPRICCTGNNVRQFFTLQDDKKWSWIQEVSYKIEYTCHKVVLSPFQIRIVQNILQFQLVEQRNKLNDNIEFLRNLKTEL